MVSNIGLKIANGEFYPILEENSAIKKRLVLTTVHDNQRSVQIDLYKSYTRTMVDALYIGSLIMENIKPRPKGEPSIELVISSSPVGEIIADAVDLDTSVRGEHQTLNVSLKSLEGESLDTEIPDFELEQNEPPPTGLLGKAEKTKKEEKAGFPWLAVIVAALLLAAVGAALWFFVFRDTGAVAADPPAVQAVQPPAPPAPPAVTPPPAAVQPPPPVIQAPAAPPPVAAPAPRLRPPPPVASFRVPAVIPRGGVPYRIRYGDTLWDIAEAFYRDPLLYPHIARFNNIRNPNLIISGTLIHVPPRN